MNFKSLIVIILSFLVAIPAFAQKDSIDLFVERQMKEQGIPGMAVGIVYHGKIIKSKGYGLENIEVNALASSQTMFKIGSISKQFVAAAILKLSDGKKLIIKDPVGKYIKGTPPSWRLMTIEHLLNHTSGLPEEPPGWDGSKVQTDSFYINKAFNIPLMSEPGKKFAYSNFGYFVLADIIRIASGLSFSEYMKQEIFLPSRLSMIRTTSAAEIIRNRANGYGKLTNGNFVNAPNFESVRAGGAFVSDINDLLKWELIMQSYKLLASKSWSAMWAQTIKTPQSMDNEPIFYGYGWMTNKVAGKQFIHHGGSMPGFRSVYFRYLDDKNAIIILSNSDVAEVYGIAFGIADLLPKLK